MVLYWHQACKMKKAKDFLNSINIRALYDQKPTLTDKPTILHPGAHKSLEKSRENESFCLLLLEHTTALPTAYVGFKKN